MWQCPKCGKELEDSAKLCWICGTSPDGTRGFHFPWEGGWGTPGGPFKAISSRLNGMPKAAGVPRRFSLGRLMMITAFFAVLFGLLSWLDAHPLVFVVVTVFITMVGLAQAILYSGKKPRKASVVAGGAVGALMSVIGLLGILVAEGGRLGIGDVIGWVFLFAVATVFWAGVGAVLGYVAGCLIAGVFLGKHVDLPEADDRRSEMPDPLAPEDAEIGAPEDPPAE